MQNNDYEQSNWGCQRCLIRLLEENLLILWPCSSTSSFHIWSVLLCKLRLWALFLQRERTWMLGSTESRMWPKKWWTTGKAYDNGPAVRLDHDGDNDCNELNGQVNEVSEESTKLVRVDCCTDEQWKITGHSMHGDDQSIKSALKIIEEDQKG